ncbi:MULTISPECIES: LysR family transcriptional regulator [Pantoea]|uniref:LysR family transcriptional regulator n=1 Tax=Pantoea TaxID=53335 RepID=UPI00177B3581|nr:MULTISPECIES: LysR family transcriptional regulator [Pantoea]MBD9644619.1 LysR family transcriptional regulator [Pantoea sp. PNT02]MDR6352979.1 DNA-binding transcriptional LysR family regulator [Pantoea sp. SORGH_AS_0659]
MNNKLNAINTFIRVAEAGSFSAAARLSGMKQSAVSQQIAALEEELGIVLLHRTTRAMKLTEQGERYLQQMQPLLAAMQDVESQLRPAQQALQGSVHIQLPSGLGQRLLPPLLALQRANPELHLTIALDDRVAELVSEGVDIALRLSEMPPEMFPARLLARIETPLFAAPERVRATPITSLAELAAHPHVRFSGIDKQAPLRLISNQETVALTVNTVFRANSSEGLLQALQADIGVGGMQLPLVQEALKSGSLVRILPQYRLPDRFLYAVFPDARFIPLRVKRVVEVIEQVVDALIPAAG